MKTCYIACALDSEIKIEKQSGDLIIGADRGYFTLVENGIMPDLAIGDFDSYTGEINCENVIKFPVKKDDTDSALAVKYAVEKGYKSIVIFGAIGGMLDHTIANISLIEKKNKKGRLVALTKALSDNHIDFKSLSIADTTDFGILRFIPSDTEKAMEVIKENGFTARLTQVIAVEVADEPGGLTNVLEILNNNDISVEYLYSFVRASGQNALIMFRVNHNEKAIKVLKEKGVTLLSQAEIDQL